MIFIDKQWNKYTLLTAEGLALDSNSTSTIIACPFNDA